MFKISASTPALMVQQFFFAGRWYSSCAEVNAVSGNNPAYWALVSNPVGGCDVVFVPSGTNYGLAGNVGYAFMPSCSNGTLIGVSCVSSTSSVGYQLADFPLFILILLLFLFALRAGFLPR